MRVSFIALACALGAVGAVGIVASGAAMAQDDAAAVAARFGALPAIEGVSLSPDGTKVVIIQPFAQGQAVMIADMVKGGVPTPIARISRDDGRILTCAWSSAERIVCSLHKIVNTAGTLLGYTRNFAVNADGSKLVQLSALQSTRALGVMQDGGDVLDWDLPDRPGSILVSRAFVPEASTGTRLAQTGDGLGVEALDTTSLRRITIERPRKNTVGYISDGQGNVRVMRTQMLEGTGYLSGTVRHYYRKANEREWLPLSSMVEGAQTADGFAPHAVDPALDVVFGFDAKDGYQALYSIALDGSAKKQVVLAHAGIDVDKLIRVGRNKRVVGASYATERRMTEYFDADLRKLGAALGKALPGGPNVDIVDASAGESKLLMIASADTQPGMVYLYDKASRHLEEVLEVRPELNGVALAPMKPITYKASDGTVIPAYLTLPLAGGGKDLPAIVMPHGGPSARDEWGFDWLVQFFAARGYAVIQPNFRGSAGYGSAWYQKNGFQSWRTAVGDVNDAGRWLVAQGIAAPSKLAIVGWSYGGYAALQSTVLDPGLFKAIVAVAPVTDLETLRQEASGYINGLIVNRFIGQGPHVREGSPAQNAARFSAPVLMFHGDLDQNVGVGESRLMAAKLRDAGKPVEYVEFPKLDHQLDSAVARTRMLLDADTFLRRHLGMR